MNEVIGLASALAAIVGPEALTTEPDNCARYTIQQRVPSCVVAPGSLEELAAVMRAAHAHQAAVAPWGGGTQQQIGNPPSRLDLVVRTERLCDVLVHEPDDLTISVAAGITIGALRAHLARHGQMLPLDPPLPARATIGGLLATGMDGPRRLGYGTLRELLIGIAVVEADGRISRGGGMVVKNVSGFDMMKLYRGSLGTLAIIASANFKLQPIPRAAATLLCHFADADAAFAALDELQDTQLTPTAAEYLNGPALASIGAPSAGAGTCALALRSEGAPAAVERHAADLRELAARHRAAAIERIDGAPEAELWGRVADLTQVAELHADEGVAKLAVLPEQTARAIAQIERLAAQHGSRATVSARALNGVIYARLQPITPAIMRGVDGVQWIASQLPSLDRWGAPPPGLDLMRRLKAEFDPAGLLNPGRFVEGI
jgi:glycolate oxidase FAD binding subunit